MTKINSPMPSMVNYPEPVTNEGMSEMGFDQTGARYRISSLRDDFDHFFGWRNSDFGTAFPVGTKMEWNQFEEGKGKIKKVGTGATFTNFELQPGYLYKLTAQLSLGSSSGGQIRRQYQWFDPSSSIGMMGTVWISDTEERLVATPAVAFIEVKDTPIVEAVTGTPSWILKSPVSTIEVVTKL